MNAVPPTARNVPAFEWSAGPEVVELCREAGLVLDGWQSLIVTDQLGMRKDGKFASLECGIAVPRQQGKGGCIEARKLAGLYLLGERTIVYTAHQFKTAQEHFLRMKDYVRNSDDLSRRVKRIHESHGEEGIELYGEGRHRLTRTQRLLYLARSKGSGRGFTGGCVILDEAQYLTGKQIAALLPVMSAMSVTGNPQVLMYGTPPDPEEVTTEGGIYWVSVRKRGLKGSPRLCWHEYSAPEGFDRRDRAVWRMTNPAIGIRLAEEFIETELEAMEAAGTPEFFDRERLGVWPADAGEGWAVIGKGPWLDARDNSSSLEDPVCFAVATNMDHTWASIAVAGRRPDGLWHVEVIDRRPSVAWVYSRVAELLTKWRNCGVVLVQTGPAGALIADIQAQTVNGYPIEVQRASTSDYAKACGMLEVGLTGVRTRGEPDPRRIRHRCGEKLDVALDNAVKAATKHYTGDVWTFDRDVETDMSPLEAAAMAVWGYAMFGQNAPELPLSVSPELRKGPDGGFFRPNGRLRL